MLFKVALLVLLVFIGCAAASKLRKPSEYDAAWAVEAQYSSVELPLDVAQREADKITDAEGVGKIHDIVSFPGLAKSIDKPGSIAAYFPGTVIIYTDHDTIAWNILVHEIAHHICIPAGLDLGHGPAFVTVERTLFSKYRPPGEYGRSVKLLWTPARR